MEINFFLFSFTAQNKLKVPTHREQAKKIKMFDSVALNVVIGLIFIYLLYSLLATVISEMVATQLQLRARNLKEAVNRMLNDEESTNWWKRFWDSVNILKNPKNTVINNFYEHPEIKYLGSSGLYRFPSAFKAVSFSKTLLNVLFGDGELTKDKIDMRLKEIVTASNGNTKILDKETAKYIKMLWTDSYGDVVKFKLQLQGWFDRTMEQATEWYKRKIQVVLLIIGFLMAWTFNADTFDIIKKLSTDNDAREKLVSMANAYIETNKDLSTDTNTSVMSEQKLDSLLEIKKRLEQDIVNANSILGLGGWPPDSVKIIAERNSTIRTSVPPVDVASLPARLKENNNGYVVIAGAKWNYFGNLFCNHFLGFLLTAIAISLGAPFWFDLLNKIMRLRTSPKQETDTVAANVPASTVSPLIREG